MAQLWDERPVIGKRPRQQLPAANTCECADVDRRRRDRSARQSLSSCRHARRDDDAPLIASHSPLQQD